MCGIHIKLRFLSYYTFRSFDSIVSLTKLLLLQIPFPHTSNVTHSTHIKRTHAHISEVVLVQCDRFVAYYTEAHSRTHITSGSAKRKEPFCYVNNRLLIVWNWNWDMCSFQIVEHLMCQLLNSARVKQSCIRTLRNKYFERFFYLLSNKEMR